MLILTRKKGESIYIGGRIKISVMDLKGNQVRLGIEAPEDERVYREEIWIQILEENRQAALAQEGSLSGFVEAWGERKKDADVSGNKETGLKRLSMGSPEVEVIRKRPREKKP